MKNILFILLFVLFASQLTVIAANKQKTKHIVMISSKDFANEHNNIFIRELNSYLQDDEYDLTKFYLNCDASCPEDIMRRKFKNALIKAELHNVDYLVLPGKLLWNEFADNIIQFKNEHDVKVGLFHIFEHELEFQLQLEDRSAPANVFVDFSRISLNTFMFYTRKNGIEFEHFYILRDSTTNSLQKTNFLKDEIHKYGDIKVDVFQIDSLQELRVTVLLLQDSPQGIIIPLLGQVSDSNDNIKMLSIINNHNVTHFEFGILNHNSDYFCFTMSHIINKDVAKYKKTPHLDLQTNIKLFLEEFDGTANQYAEEEIYFILNESRVKKISNGRKLLKFKNEFVDCLR